MGIYIRLIIWQQEFLETLFQNNLIQSSSGEHWWTFMNPRIWGNLSWQSEICMKNNSWCIIRWSWFGIVWLPLPGLSTKWYQQMRRWSAVFQPKRLFCSPAILFESYNPRILEVENQWKSTFHRETHPSLEESWDTQKPTWPLCYGCISHQETRSASQ